MVQYKKDDIKKKIDDTALNIFAERGYCNTSISDIAKKANVSVGNIYRYYKGKDEIFYSVAPADFLDSLKGALRNKISSAKDKVPGKNEYSDSFFLTNEGFIEFMASNRERMLIFFIGSESTRYESEKNELINYWIQTVKDNYSEKDNEIIFDSKNDYIVRLLFMKLIEMIMDVLKVSKTFLEIKSSLSILNTYHLFGVTKLFK